MKKLLLIACLISSITTHAQLYTEYLRTHTESTFNMSQSYIYNRHVVTLRDNEQIIIEMADVTDYTMLSNLDSLLRSALEDVVFYKDSVAPLDNIRIDYATTLESDNTLIRFRKYRPDGDIYIKRHGELAHMKIERDTFRLTLRKPLLEHNSHMHFYDYPVQVTFLMNTYTNLYNLLQDKGVLKQAIDTMAHATLPKVYNPEISKHRTLVEYRPYSKDKTLIVQHLDTELLVNNRKNK